MLSTCANKRPMMGNAKSRSMKSVLEVMMKRLLALPILGLLLAHVLSIHGQEKSPLKFLQKIPMPNVKGRLDHFGVDLKGMRLFVAALGEDQNTVEVIDIKSEKWVASIPGQSKPQGLFYSPDFKKLFVANGTDGTCKIFRGDTFKLIDSLPLGTNANQVGYDPDTKYLYAGLGDRNSGTLAIIDTSSNQHIGDIKTDARPGGITFEKSGARIFVNLNGATKLGVLDRKKREQITTWPVAGAENYGPLALDESRHRLFLGSRKPPMLIVFDSDAG